MKKLNGNVLEVGIGHINYYGPTLSIMDFTSENIIFSSYFITIIKI